MKLHLIQTEYAAGGVVVEDGVVTEAAPIFQWMVGERWEKVREWSRLISVRDVDEIPD